MPRIWILALAVFLASCQKDGSYRTENASVYNFKELPPEVFVPSKAWDLLEFKGTTLSFSEIQVLLNQKSDGVVRNGSAKVQFLRGGGTLDLEKILGDQTGTFFLGFDFPEFEKAEEKKVIFVSRSKKRKIGEEVLGAGCNQFFDITDQFQKAMKKEGIKLNTSAARHLNVIGGHFLFAAKDGNITRVAQVTFKDSRFPNLFCEEL